MCAGTRMNKGKFKLQKESSYKLHSLLSSDGDE